MLGINHGFDKALEITVKYLESHGYPEAEEEPLRQFVEDGKQQIMDILKLTLNKHKRRK